MNHFKGKQFQQDVIIVAVGYYLRYNLSYREVQEILYDRGINVSHTTIYRWVQEYGKRLYQIWKKKNKKSFYSWKMDETYIKIKGKWHYLYRAIDADGLTKYLTLVHFSFVLLSNSHYRRKDFFMQKNRLGNFPTRFIIEPLSLSEQPLYFMGFS